MVLGKRKVQFINRVYNALDNGHKCIGLFMDLSKAFDLVNYKILEHKLYNYGLRGKLSDWLMSYLDNRRQVVDINGILSDI